MHKIWPALLIATLLIGCNRTETADNKDSRSGKTESHQHDHDHDHSGHDHANHSHGDGNEVTGDRATLTKIKKELNKKQREIMAEARAMSPKEGAAFAQSFDFAEFGKRLIELASKTEDESVRFDALRSAARTCSGKEGYDALVEIANNGPFNEKSVKLIQGRMLGLPSSQVFELFDTFLNNADNREAKGQAIAAQQQVIDMIAPMAGQTLPGAPDSVNEFFSSFDTETMQAKSLELVKLMSSEYADVKSRQSTLGEIAADKLFVLENLSVGKTAPDIVGKDLDGKEFRLSDYRGKVVLLDFWGDW